MRLQDYVVLTHAAPAAGMSVASFHEINGALIFGAPQTLHYLILLFVDLNEAAGWKNRIHREILVADVAVGEIAVRELGKIGERHQAPLLYHAAQIRGALLVKAGIHADRHLHRRESREGLGNMRPRRRNEA